jgi:hypothetical protein
MRKQRDLQVCVADIQAALAIYGLEPEQRNALENALKSIKQLRRLSVADKVKTYEVVRTITEALVKVFVKHY